MCHHSSSQCELSYLFKICVRHIWLLCVVDSSFVARTSEVNKVRAASENAPHSKHTCHNRTTSLEDQTHGRRPHSIESWSMIWISYNNICMKCDSPQCQRFLHRELVMRNSQNGQNSKASRSTVLGLQAFRGMGWVLSHSVELRLESRSLRSRVDRLNTVVGW